MDSSFETSSILYESYYEPVMLSVLESNPQIKVDGISNKDFSFQVIFDEEKVKKSEVKAPDNCLRASDFGENLIGAEFFYEAKFDLLTSKITKIRKELSNINLNNPTREMIYKTKSIEEMVEQTYQYQHNIKTQMEEEASYLKKVIYSWRKVAGDGNCFYRSAIFSWLEYLVFKMRIDILKLVIYDLETKFCNDYINTKRLPSNLNKLYSSTNKELAIVILSIIISDLETKKINNNNIKIKLAYETLIKAFNSSYFDTVMILYFRYKLYEFILENQDKIFSTDFPVLLGNLLPEQYETQEGKFLFDKYFEEDLLKFYTCAEKLAIYLTPFVLKVNLRVIMYDFGKNCDIETKDFKSYLDNKDTIYVLFRKAHYDICYSIEYFEQFNQFMCMFESKPVILKVINKTSLMKKEKEIKNVVVEGSKVFNRQMKLKENQQKEEKKNEIKEDIEININLNEIIKLFELRKSCYVCNKKIPSIDEFKEKFILPCGCELNLHSSECIFKFISNFNSLVKKDITNKDNLFECKLCCKIYQRFQLIEICQKIEEMFKDSTCKESLKKTLNDLFIRKCMLCLQTIGEEEFKRTIICKNSEIGKFIGMVKFTHLKCNQCKKNENGICKICENYHSRVISE